MYFFYIIFIHYDNHVSCMICSMYHYDYHCQLLRHLALKYHLKNQFFFSLPGIPGIIVNYRVIVSFSFITKHFTNSLTHFQLHNSQQRFNRLMYTMTFKYCDWHFLFMKAVIIIRSHIVTSSGLICMKLLWYDLQIFSEQTIYTGGF